ncbi:hypothetical protein CI610_03424 [invertebrate metagenome]|uniref:Serpin domain-containing protein n=1 Tax=invertebrate metagenome TaxID=1711999 RepID=A0A2H9T338_9ZZZZ
MLTFHFRVICILFFAAISFHSQKALSIIKVMTQALTSEEQKTPHQQAEKINDKWLKHLWSVSDKLSSAHMERTTNNVISSFGITGCLSPLLLGMGNDTKKQAEEFFQCEGKIEEFCYGMASQAEIFQKTDAIGQTTLLYLNDCFNASPEYMKKLNCLVNYMPSCPSLIESREDLSTQEFMKKINELVNEKTEGNIPELLSEPFSPFAKIIAVNIIFLKAKWADGPLKESYNFTFEGNSCPGIIYEDVRVATINNDIEWSIASLPMAGDCFVLLVMPHKDLGNKTETFKALKDFSLEKTMESLHRSQITCHTDHQDDDSLSELECMLGNVYFRKDTPKYVHRNKYDVHFPKLKIASENSVGEILVKTKQLDKPFGKDADFSELSPTLTQGSGFSLFQLTQKATFLVNEDGVEAAAATYASAGYFCCRKEPEKLFYNRPFKLYVVHKNAAPLFEVIIMENPTP